MTRRSLFARLAGALAASAAIDPDRLLWVPGQKMISIPQPRLKKIIRVPIINKIGGAYGGWDGDLGRGSYMSVSYELREVDADYQCDPNQIVLREFWPRAEFDRRFATVGA